jgi:hypothetical protein
LDLREVDLEVLADVEDLPDDLVREIEHLLSQSSVCSLLAVATNKKRCKFEAQADGSRSIVAIVLAGIQKAKIGNIIGLGELLRLRQLRDAVVAGVDDGTVEVLVPA